MERIASLMLVLACRLAAQLPGGSVVDENGKPVAGARVRIAFRTAEPVRAREIEDLLAADPLPIVFTDAEGRFTLPLPALANGPGATYGLIVEKAGYQPWRERLPERLGLYRGSRVLLRALRDEDRASIEVEDPQPGMIVLAERVEARSSIDDATIGGEAFEVRVDRGRAELTLPLLPSPCAVAAGSEWAQLGYRARLLSPGRTSEPFPMGPGTRRTLGRSKAPPRVVARCSRSDGKPVENARGLFRCPDRRLRWFPLRAGEVLEDHNLELVALCADGCAATLDVARAVVPVLEAKLSASLRLVDGDGKTVRDARATWFPLVEWKDAERPLGDGRRRAKTLRVEADAVLPLEVPDEPGFLVVEAPGHTAETILEPRALRGKPDRILPAVPSGALRVRVTCAREPVAGIVLHSSRLAGRVLRTDADGIAEVERVPAGPVTLRVCSPDRVVGECYGVGAEIVAGAVAEVPIELTPMAVHEIAAKTAGGEPAPFTPLEFKLESGSGCSWLTDSYGNLRLPWPEKERLTIREQRHRLAPPRAQDVVADKPVIVPSCDATLVVVRFEPGVFNRERTWISNGKLTGGSNGGAVDPCACGVLLRWPHAGKPTYVVDLQGTAPLVITHDEVVAAGSGIVEIDRRNFVRRVPLRLVGDVPKDLADLHVVPRGTGTFEYHGWGSVGEMLARDADGQLCVAARDLAHHVLTIAHPECLPARVDLASGPVKEIEVRLERGTAATLQFRIERPFRDDQVGTNSVVITGGKGRFEKRIFTGPIPLASLRAAKPDELVTVACPVALPPEQITLTVITVCGSATTQVEVAAGKPLTVDVGMLR